MWISLLNVTPMECWIVCEHNTCTFTWTDIWAHTCFPADIHPLTHSLTSWQSASHYHTDILYTQAAPPPPSSWRGRRISWAVSDIVYLACHTDVTVMLLTPPACTVECEWQRLRWMLPVCLSRCAGPSYAPHDPQMNYTDKWFSEALCARLMCTCAWQVTGYITRLPKSHPV